MRFRFCLPFLFALPMLLLSSASSQESRPDNATGQTQAKASKKQRQRANQEIRGTRLDWLEQDAIYIITPAEREAFLQLGTNEERDSFIEHFWQLRNPHPESSENSFKEEHYRRMAFANEHFSSGIPGWKTDRGHIYILWGSPDEVESHPTGGIYDRPMWQGGGSTTTYA